MVSEELLQLGDLPARAARRSRATPRPSWRFPRARLRRWQGALRSPGAGPPGDGVEDPRPARPALVPRRIPRDVARARRASRRCCSPAKRSLASRWRPRALASAFLVSRKSSRIFWRPVSSSARRSSSSGVPWIALSVSPCGIDISWTSERVMPARAISPCHCLGPSQCLAGIFDRRSRSSSSLRPFPRPRRLAPGRARSGGDHARNLADGGHVPSALATAPGIGEQATLATAALRIGEHRAQQCALGAVGGFALVV